jgi:hypothetical protein
MFLEHIASGFVSGSSVVSCDMQLVLCSHVYAIKMLNSQMIGESARGSLRAVIRKY